MLKEILVPDLGSYSNVEIIEVLVAIGDSINKDTSLITLETEKATMEIPSPYAGVIKSLHVKVGDKVSVGSLILSLETEEAKETTKEIKETKEESLKNKEEDQPASAPSLAVSSTEIKSFETQASKASAKQMPNALPPEENVVVNNLAHAGPAVRRFARELGVDLSKIQGTGRKDRILIADVQAYVKNILSRSLMASDNIAGGISLSAWPQIDHSKFGEVAVEPLSRIKKLSGSYLHRNWVMVPHVTQFDEADITELETFRKEQQSLAEQQGVKLTPLVFIMKAITTSLKAFPTFNASLDSSGSQLILKKYFHLGVAVDTPNGLVVPVIRDVDQKGLFQLAKELGEVSQKARKGLLTAFDMQGSSFSISSLGGIGGTSFTPIINVPDVAILGISKSQIKPIYQENEFKPRLMLPLSLSYDHRVIDGAEAARFITFLVKQLTDIRRLLL